MIDSITTSYVNIIIYIVVWLVTIIRYQFKKGYFDAGSLILSSLLIYSIASLYLFDDDIYAFSDIYVFPFVYMYLMYMLALAPILKYDVNKIKEIQKPNSLLLNVVSMVYILASLSQLSAVITNFSSSIGNLLYSASGGQELYDDAMSSSYGSGSGITNLPAIISGAFANFGVLLTFYYMTLKRYSKLILIGLLLSTASILIAYITLGQRGLIMEILFSVIITYYALEKFLRPKAKTITKYVGILLIIATTIPVIALTNSRFGNTVGGSQSSLYFYTGQANLFFNNHGLDNNGIRYGDRTFPLFKRMVGFNNVPNNFWERRQKYSNLDINDSVFTSFVGDFALDYGPSIALLMFIVFTLIVIKITRIRNQILKFHQLILLHYVMCVCFLGGLKSFVFSDVGGNLQIIIYFTMFLTFWYSYDHRRRFQRRV